MQALKFLRKHISELLVVLLASLLSFKKKMVCSFCSKIKPFFVEKKRFLSYFWTVSFHSLIDSCSGGWFLRISHRGSRH